LVEEEEGTLEDAMNATAREKATSPIPSEERAGGTAVVAWSLCELLW
jgi:hypothetical protein